MEGIKELPTDYSKNVVEEIVKNKFNEYTLTVSSAAKKGDNFLGEIYRVIAKDSKCESSISFIVKIAPRDEIVRSQVFFEKFYIREHFVYTYMFPVLMKLQENSKIPYEQRFYCPKLYHSSVLEKNELLVMEDLSVNGFVMHDKIETFDYNHFCLIIKKLASFHALSAVLKIKDPKEYSKIAEQSSDFIEFEETYMVYIKKVGKSLIKILENESYKDKIAKCLKTMSDDLNMIYCPATAEPYNLLCHGDCWVSNFLFKYQNGKVIDMIIIDWQIMRNLSPVTDLAFIIMAGTDKKFREQYYEEMLDLYYKTLKNHTTLMGCDLNDVYPEHIYRDHIKKYMVSGMLISFSELPIIFSNEKEVPNLTDLFSKDTHPDITFSEECIIRIKDIIEDCIKYGVI